MAMPLPHAEIAMVAVAPDPPPPVNPTVIAAATASVCPVPEVVINTSLTMPPVTTAVAATPAGAPVRVTVGAVV